MTSYVKYYDSIATLESIYNDNANVLIELFSGNAYRPSALSSYSAPTVNIEDYTITTSTTTADYIPCKIPADIYYQQSGVLVTSSNAFGSDNVRWGYRLAKFLFKYDATSVSNYDEIVTIAVSSISYLFKYYKTNTSLAYNLSNQNINVYQISSSGVNDASAVLPMLCAIDALINKGNSVPDYTVAVDPRTYYQPRSPATSTNVYAPNDTVSYPGLSARATSAGYISYIDLYGLRNLLTASDPTADNNDYACKAYPFFNLDAGAQQLGLGFVSFLLTNEGQEQYDAFSSYSGYTSTGSKYTGIQVYQNESPDTSLYSIAEDIVATYWILGYLGLGFGKTNPSAGTPTAYLAQYLIDNVNYSGTVPTTNYTVGVQISNTTNGLLDAYPTLDSSEKLFDIWSCCDTSWQFESGVLGASNKCDVDMEMFSYQILAAALTKDYEKFCKFHRYFHYMLYVQNWTSDGVSKMGDANTQTYDYTTNRPPGFGSTSTYSNRNKSFSTTKYPWLYSSYCAGYQPYANFYGKVDVTYSGNTDGTTLGQPIYIMSNPYYKGNSSNNYNDIASASDADFNICFAYKIAYNLWESGDWARFDQLTDKALNATVSDEIRYKVGAHADITWDYMYNQIKYTILSETGANAIGTEIYPEGSNFAPGIVLPGNYEGTNYKYLATTGHDTNQYSNLHPDYIDLALFQDFVLEGTASCFLEGTKILTSRGYVHVEELTKTDQVVSYGDILENKLYEKDIRVVPIRWVGKYSKSKPCPKHQPICFAKDSISAGMPFSDVYFSGNHGVVLRKKRVPAKKLIGDKIYKVPFENVVYYHVEVEGHQVISANGMLSETYLETGKRRAFTTVFSNVD